MGKRVSSKVDKWLTKDNLFLIKCWARDFTLTEVSEKMGIAPKTLIEWRNLYPEIDEAVTQGKEIVDYRVENALLKRALGYTTVETKTIISPPDKDGNRKIRVEKVEKEIGPDPTACMAWLNNRKPEQWKRNRDNILSTEDKANGITVNIIQHSKKNKDDEEEWTASTDTKKHSNSNNSSKKRKNKKVSDGDDIEYTDEEKEWLGE